MSASPRAPPRPAASTLALTHQRSFPQPLHLLTRSPEPLSLTNLTFPKPPLNVPQIALVRDAGARTRLAGGITGAVVLLLLPFTSALEDLPTAVLGACIIMAVRSLMTVRPFLQYRRYSRLQFSIAVITFGVTIAMAPHVERVIIAGVALAIAAHLWREARVSINSWTKGTTLHIAPKGVLYFASAPRLEERLGTMLSETPTAEQLVVHLDGLGRIDVSGALGLRSVLEGAQQAGLDTTVCDVPPQARRIVQRVLEGRHGS